MRYPLAGCWKETETEVVLIERLHEARTYFQRLRGLQFYKPLAPGSGLLLSNCRSIHTMWMRFTIDVVFVDQEMTILEIHRRVKPWRFVVPKAKDVAHAIEFASGWEAQCRVGGRTEMLI